MQSAWPGPLAGLAAFAVYARTLPYSLTWAHNGADGGDLLAAALTHGVPHPTGYPTHQLLLRFALWLYPGEPARAGAWLSAICAALAAGLLADLARRIALTDPAQRPPLAGLASLIAAATWGISPLLWGQATIVEVYALNALFCVALLWLLWRWAEGANTGGRGAAWLGLAGLIFGLGLGNHLTLALMLPGGLYWIRAKGRGRANMSRALMFAALATLAGLLVYAYLPLAASTRPPINWGDPVTLDGFLWVATGRLYAPLAFGLPLAELPARLLGWSTSTAIQFAPWGLVIALAGLWRLDGRLRAWWAATLLIWLAFTLYAVGYNSADSDAYVIPALAVMALWLAEGLAWGLALVDRLGLPALRRALLALVITGASIALIAAPAAWRWEEQDLRRDWLAQEASRAAADAEPGSVILTASDRATFGLWYTVYGLQAYPDVAVVNVNLYGYDWYRRTLAEKHPNLLPSVDTARPLETLVSGWLAERPVYVAEDVGLPLRLGGQTPSGRLIRVVGWLN